MSTISLRIPDSLHKSIKGLAKSEKVSINQLITIALSEKISALMTEQYLRDRAEKGSKEKYLVALSKVPDEQPIAGDEL